MRRLMVLAIALAANGPAAATPVSFNLEDPGDSEVRIQLLGYDDFDSVRLVDQDEVPSGGSVSGELLGTLDPGLDISRFSLAWGPLSYSGTVPNVGPFTLSLIPFEVHFFGDPLLNLQGRVKPTQDRGLYATSSTGAPSGTLTVDGNSVDFAFEALNCLSGPIPTSCFGGTTPPAHLTTTNLTDIEVGAASTGGATPPWKALLLTVGDVTFRIEIGAVHAFDAQYVVPEPTTAVLLATGLAGLAVGGRQRSS